MPDGSTSTHSRPRCRLISADQRITHPDGGIALLTEAGHAIRATALFAATYIPAFLGMLSGFAIGSVPLVAVTVPAVVVSALILGSRCERPIRARRAFDTARHPWVLSDVATEPHLGIGNQLLSEVVRRADAATADIVLTVAQDNATARARYVRHHFLLIKGRGRTIAMRRQVRARLSGSDRPQLEPSADQLDGEGADLPFES